MRPTSHPKAIAIYIAVLGLLNPTAEATTQDVTIMRLVCFVVGLMVAISLPFVTFKGGNLTRREQRRRQVIVATPAAAAFAVYSATMPSFFLGHDPHDRLLPVGGRGGHPHGPVPADAG